MRLLDLFAGPGGATVGYERAGFEVVGVDLEPWACYPGKCREADAMSVLRDEVPGLESWRFDAIHASPPCQSYSSLRHVGAYDEGDFPDLLAETIELLEAIRKPYVVENVPGAGRVAGFDMLLCGSMFEGVTVRRHRYFRMGNWDSPIMAPATCNHALLMRGSIYANWGRGDSVKNIPPTSMREYLDGLGLDWVGDKSHVGRRLGGMAEAIPPAYTEWIGTQLMTYLKTQVVA